MSHKHDDDTLTRQHLADRLEEWARGLRAGRLEVEGKTWGVPEEVAAEFSLKEKKGSLALKLKCRWETLAEYHPEAREPVVRWQESFKTLKKRMAVQFKGLQQTISQGQFPDSKALADLVRDSQAMAKMGEPEWGEAMESYLAHIAALERAVAGQDLTAAQHEMADLHTAMVTCHRELK
jgi:XXXCH domain-containing protein